MSRGITIFDPSGLSKLSLELKKKGFYLPDPLAKIGWIRGQIKKMKLAVLKRGDLFSKEDVLLIHKLSYVNALIKGNPRRLAESSGLPWTPNLWGVLLSVEGCVYNAAKVALKEGISGALATGIHHATPTRGGGFCAVNGFAVAIRKLQKRGLVKKVLILDLDVHYGDGSTLIFSKDKNVYFFDLYGKTYIGSENVQKSSTFKKFKRIEDFKGYFKELREFPSFLKNASPDIIFYLSGMDVFTGDRYGGIPGMDSAAIRKREKFVFSTIASEKTPLVFALGGGYIKYRYPSGKLYNAGLVKRARQHLVDLHMITIKEANFAFQRFFKNKSQQNLPYPSQK